MSVSEMLAFSWQAIAFHTFESEKHILNVLSAIFLLVKLPHPHRSTPLNGAPLFSLSLFSIVHYTKLKGGIWWHVVIFCKNFYSLSNKKSEKNFSFF